MNKWTKYFADGTKYVGEDEAVKKRVASWRNSRSNNIIAVDMEHSGYLLRIEGIGEYWQSDSYEVIYPLSYPVLLKRRIEKLIESYDKTFAFLIKDNNATVRFNSTASVCTNIIDSMIGKWLILEYTLQSKKAYCYINDDKI